MGPTNLYAYDGAGRLTNHVVDGQTRTFAYNFQGRMTSLTDIDGSVFAYEFDGEGNRLSQSLNDCLSKRFVYDGADVLLELNPTNGVAYAWINGPGIDQPIERLLYIDGAPRARRVFHADALGSIAALSDPSGRVTQTYTYAAFGSIRHKTGHDPNRVTYTAREQLGDSQGSMYYRHRVYAPNFGRFVETDSLGFADGVNSYIYVRNLATMATDPLGYWGIQFGDFNLGIGNPWLAFDMDSLGDGLRGALAGFDGFIPFVDPFSGFYANSNGKVDFAFRCSREIGGITRTLMLSVMVPNAKAWLRNPLLYEIGQKTVSTELYNTVQSLSPIERGAYYIQTQGWLKALFGISPRNFLKTLSTGLTPGGWFFVIGTTHVVDESFFTE